MKSGKLSMTGTPDEVRRCVIQVLQTRDQKGRTHTPMILGSSGLGKSTITESIAQYFADDLNLKLVDSITPSAEEFGYKEMRSALYESIDFSGLPYIEQGIQKRAFLGNLPVSGQGILFLDEFAQAPPSVQTVLSQLIYEKRIGDYRLPEDWMIVVAGNRAMDRAGSNKITTNNTTRVWNCTIESDSDNWINWASQNDVHQDVISYIGFRQDALNQFDAKCIGAQAVPRTWVMVSDMLKTDPDKGLYDLLFSGYIGEEQAIEFSTFLSLKDDVPNLRDILSGAKVDVPDEVGICYATICALLGAMADAKDEVIHDYFDNALAFINRFPTPEFAIMFVRQITSKRVELKESETFIAFKVLNKDLEI